MTKSKGARVAVALRLSPVLHNRLVAIAEANGEPLNDWMVRCLETKGETGKQKYEDGEVE